MTALRLSAILSILVAALYAYGVSVQLAHGVYGGAVIAWMLMFVIVPLAAGVLALSSRATFLLPASWGWVLGVFLPKVLMPRPQMPANMVHEMLKVGDRVYVIGPDYQAMAVACVALLGLVLCGYSYYRERHLNPPAP
jgi:hypothetical protein